MTASKKTLAETRSSASLLRNAAISDLRSRTLTVPYSSRAFLSAATLRSRRISSSLDVPAIRSADPGDAVTDDVALVTVGLPAVLARDPRSVGGPLLVRHDRLRDRIGRVLRDARHRPQPSKGPDPLDLLVGDRLPVELRPPQDGRRPLLLGDLSPEATLVLGELLRGPLDLLLGPVGTLERPLHRLSRPPRCP